MTLREKLITILKGSYRIGEEVDIPEGVRYIYISDTLANELIKELEVDENGNI